MRLKRSIIPVVLASLALSISGCVLLGDKIDQFRWQFMTVPIFIFDNAAGYNCPPQTSVMEQPVNFAVAISGGGDRSAVFAAAVLEQLASMPDPNHSGRSLLDSCDVISGVSGGSMAAAYYSLYKPNDFSSQEETAAFFQRFKSNMTTDINWHGAAHYLTAPWEAVGKYYSRYRLVQTLGNTLDQHIFKNADFNHLQEREQHGEAPVTIINGTSLDTGQKFLFTNLNVASNFRLDPLGFSKSVSGPDKQALMILSQIASSSIYTSFGFDSINSNIGCFHLAHAVAASSAYPVVPGPAVLQNHATPGYVHIGDGGINDNSGVDSIIGLYMSKLQASGRHKKLVVISINVGQPLRPKKLGDPDGYMSSIEYVDRASVALNTRAQTLATVMYNVPSSIAVIGINLAEASNVHQLKDEAAMLAISVNDMNTCIQAACELVARNRSLILGALSGRS